MSKMKYLILLLIPVLLLSGCSRRLPTLEAEDGYGIRAEEKDMAERETKEGEISRKSAEADETNGAEDIREKEEPEALRPEAGETGSGEEVNAEEADPGEGKEADVYLQINKDTYLLSEEAVDYEIVNNTGKSVEIVMAPFLEKEVDGSWVTVKSNVGFCGTPDSLSENREDSLPLTWFPDITKGIYRLSFTYYIVNEKGDREEAKISDTFELL